jgi:hypothetical protein
VNEGEGQLFSDFPDGICSEPNGNNREATILGFLVAYHFCVWCDQHNAQLADLSPGVPAQSGSAKSLLVQIVLEPKTAGKMLFEIVRTRRAGRHADRLDSTRPHMNDAFIFLKWSLDEQIG